MKKISMKDETAFECSFMGQLFNKSGTKLNKVRPLPHQISSDESTSGNSSPNSFERISDDSEGALQNNSLDRHDKKQIESERSSLLSSTYLLSLVYFIISGRTK